MLFFFRRNQREQNALPVSASCFSSLGVVQALLATFGRRIDAPENETQASHGPVLHDLVLAASFAILLLFGFDCSSRSRGSDHPQGAASPPIVMVALVIRETILIEMTPCMYRKGT